MSWIGPIASFGGFINNVNPAAQDISKGGYKQIKYQNPDGAWCIVSPYATGPQTINIKPDSAVYFQMYSGVAQGHFSSIPLNIDGQVISNEGYDADNTGRLIYQYYVPSSDLSLTTFEDTNYLSQRRYYWYCRLWQV